MPARPDLCKLSPIPALFAPILRIDDSNNNNSNIKRTSEKLIFPFPTAREREPSEEWVHSRRECAGNAHARHLQRHNNNQKSTDQTNTTQRLYDWQITQLSDSWKTKSKKSRTKLFLLVLQAKAKKMWKKKRRTFLCAFFALKIEKTPIHEKKARGGEWERAVLREVAVWGHHSSWMDVWHISDPRTWREEPQKKAF